MTLPRSVAVIVLLLAVGAAARRQPRPIAGRWLLQGSAKPANGTATTTTKPAGGQGFQKHGADFCNCPDDDKAVCGTDQQTYLNECVMRCAGAIKLKDGVCNKACYPPGEKREGGDWSSRAPVCASGITYMNRAEAMYDGYPDECIVEGVCKYVDIGNGPVSYEPTTGGKGKSEWAGRLCCAWLCCAGLLGEPRYVNLHTVLQLQLDWSQRTLPTSSTTALLAASMPTFCCCSSCCLMCCHPPAAC
jgi:hypothetical protein